MTMILVPSAGLTHARVCRHCFGEIERDPDQPLAEVWRHGFTRKRSCSPVYNAEPYLPGPLR